MSYLFNQTTFSSEPVQDTYTNTRVKWHNKTSSDLAKMNDAKMNDAKKNDVDPDEMDESNEWWLQDWNVYV